MKTIEMTFGDLALISALLVLVAILSTVYRQLIHLKLSLQYVTPTTSIFAWTIETIQLYVVSVGSTKLITALGPVLDDGDFLSLTYGKQMSCNLATVLLLYTLAVLAIDWVDATIASASLQTVHTAPLMLTRAMLFGPERIWVLEPAPLPPWPTRQSKRARRRSRRSRSAFQTARQRIPQYVPSNHEEPASSVHGRHITFADGIPAFPNKSQTEHASKVYQNPRAYGQVAHMEAAEHESQHAGSLPTPPSSREGFVTSRVRALSGIISPSASPLARNSHAA